MIDTREIQLVRNDLSVRDFYVLNLFQVVQGLSVSWRREIIVKGNHLFLFGELQEWRINGRATGKIVWPHESDVEVLDHKGIIFNLRHKLVHGATI